MSHVPERPPAPPGPEPWSAIRAAVGDLRASGFAVCRVRRGDKTPDHAGWPTGSLGPEDFRDGDSVGIVCGWPSAGNVPGHAVVYLDLDSPDAVARADHFLPATGMIEGRPGKPRSHRYYLVPVGNLSPDDTSTAPVALAGALAAGKHPGPRSRRFTLPGGSEALALKGSGALAVCPPSSHPSGETRLWEGGGIGEPARVDYRDLLDAAARLAAAVGCRAGTPGRSTPAGPRAVRSPSPADRGGTTEQLALLAAAGRGAPVRVGGREFGPVDRVERGRRYLAAIPDDDLSRSGRGGHTTFFRHARLLANDFLVRDRPALAELLARYNSRLRALDLARPGEGFEAWSEADLAHKIDDALDGGVAAEFPPGCKLAAATPGGDPPRAWDDPARLADEFLGGDEIRFLNGTAFVYEDGRYAVTSHHVLAARVRRFVEGRSDDEFGRLRAELESQLRQVAGGGGPGSPLARLPRQGSSAAPRVTIKLVDEVIAAARARRQLPDRQPLDVWLAGGREPVLGVANGLLDLRTRDLTPHSADWFSTVQLPVRFDPAAPPPGRFLACLRDWTGDDAALTAVLQEVTGACLDVHLRVKFFALLVGEGDNGKSAFLAVLRSLLGVANVASVGLDDLARNRFATFGLLGKLANLVGDQGYVELTDEGKLKQLTGGDLVTFEQKNRDPIFAVNAAKIIVAANTPPTFGDKSPAVWSRLVLVPFDQVVPPAQRDPTLLDGRTWAGELPGVLNWALAGLQRLHANGRFTDCPRVRAARDRHRADSNPARAFLLGQYREDPTGGFVATDEMYAAYRGWCEQTGHSRPLTLPTFAREIGRVFPRAQSDQVRNAGGRHRGWQGLVAIPPGN